jgi:hypothetical protein
MSISLAPHGRLELRDAFTRKSLTSANAVLIYLALVSFIGHMLVAGNYGYFRDELYYLADGQHLALGYVDQPLLLGWLAALLNLLAGDGLVAIHVIPALAGGAIVIITGLIAREMGGGRLAEALAATAALFTVIFMATASIFSMDVLDALWWALGTYVVVRLFHRQQPRLWLVFGVVAGIGLMTKLTIGFFGLALVVGLLLTPARAAFRQRWIWLGGAIAFVGLLPYVIWNAVNGWPTVAFWHHYGGLSGGGPVGFLANVLLILNIVNLPLAIAGLYFYFRAPAGTPYRALGWTFVVLYLVLTAINAKPYFIGPAFPLLLAPGAVVFERAALTQRARWINPAYIALIALSGLFFAPLAMPVLPPTVFASNYAFLSGLGNGGAGQAGGKTPFPQYLADRFGWDAMTAQVAAVYNGLPASERAQACIYTDNYGEASALNFFGPADHLPPAISGHNNYFLWGPGACSGQVLISVNISQSDLLKSYSSVVSAGAVSCQYCEDYENGAPIYVATHPKVSVKDAWPSTKHFN